MTQPAQSNLVTVNIDGKEIAVPKGTNIIEVASQLHVDIPHYCYHPKLQVVGNCRMCMVEMGLPAVDRETRQPIMDEATGKQKINWIPRLQIACGTQASEGMHIRTKTPLVKDARESVTEFLLLNHPLDCPICDKAGECLLQEQSLSYGRGYSRFIGQKNVKPKRTLLGPRVMLDDERCILCSRCIRFSRDIAGEDVLGFVDRGSYSTLTTHPDKKLDHNYSLNTVDICPVGALTSTDFRFKMRTWFLKQTRSICAESSVGANTTVWSREGVIYRVTPRRNDEVNDTWMTDSGRELYKLVEAENRLKTPARPVDALVADAARLLKAGPVAFVGSGHASVEEQFALKKLAGAVGASISLVGHVGEGDKLLLSADRTPNTRGALVTGVISQLPGARLDSLAADIDAGKIKTLLVHLEDVTAAGLSAAQLAKVNLIFIGTHASDTTAAAAVVIPTLTPFEKSGTFVNQQFRIQKFSAAIPGPQGTADDLAVLAKLTAAVGGQVAGNTVATVWSVLAAEIPALAGLSFANLPGTGALLDAVQWKDLPFVEGETLHYKPAVASA